METLYLLFDASWLRESIIERSYVIYIIFPDQELFLTHCHRIEASFKHECLFPQWQQLIVKREVVWGEARVCGYQHIGIFFQNVYKLLFQIRLYFLLSFRKILSNPRTMELCLMERLKLCCNLKKCQSHHYLGLLFSICHYFQFWQTWHLKRVIQPPVT